MDENTNLMWDPILMFLTRSIPYLFLRRYLLFALLTAVAAPTCTIAADYKIVTANLPPWSIDGNRGIFPDIVAEIEKRLGTNNKPEFIPWSRAQNYAQQNCNYIIFPLTRNKWREDKYTWLVDVIESSLHFITIDGGQFDLESAKKLDVILVHQDAPPSAILEAKGFTNLHKHPAGVEPLAKMLTLKRGDAWFGPRIFAEYVANETDLGGQLVLGPAISVDRLYIAGSKNISKELVENYRRIFNSLKEDGTIQKIIRSYSGK